MKSPADRSPTPQAGSPANRTRGAFAKRRAVAFFIAAGIAALLAVTSWWWLPALPALFGTIEAKSDLIGAFADLTTIVNSALLLVVVVLGYLGYSSLQGSSADGEARQAVDAAQGGRGAAVGDVNQGAVVAGDNNRVSLEFTGGVAYNYSGVAPSSAEPGKLEEARQRLEELPLEEVPDRQPTLPQRSVMRLRPNPNFVGRRGELERVAANLKVGDATAIGEVTVAASSGLGGVGKTQLACEFVYRYGQYFHSVYWLSFAEPGDVPGEVASCGGPGGMDLRQDYHTLPLEERVRMVMSEWQSELPRLLVFDNCEEEDLLDRWLPPTGGCRVLVTSRRGGWDAALGVSDLPLRVFDRRESVGLLREYRPDLPPDDPDLDAIAEELGDLPLALDLAGRHLNRYRHDVMPGAYLADLRRPELLEHPSLRRARGISPTRHDMDVWRTFFLGYRRLDQNDETAGAAVRLLARVARLAPGEPIPRELLARALDPPGATAEPPRPATRTQDAMDRLTAIGLLTKGGDETFVTHRLVAAFAFAEIADEEAQPAAEWALGKVALDPSVQAQPVRSLTLLPHLRHATENSADREDKPAGIVCYALSVNLGNTGSYREAVPYMERALKITTKVRGADHPITLRQRNDLGVLMKRAGDHAGASRVLEDVLEDQKRLLGPRHHDVASTILNIASLLREQGLYHEVLPRYRETLTIREEALAHTDPDSLDRRQLLSDVAESLHNIGAALMDLGRHREASPHFKRALLIYERDLKEVRHVRYAGLSLRLGSALRAQKDYRRARKRFERALNVYSDVLEEGHEETAKNLMNLGALLKELADGEDSLSVAERDEILSSARGRLEEGLTFSERLYGKDHPITGGVVRELAGVANAEDRREDEWSYRERAEAVREAFFDSVSADSPDELDKSAMALGERGLYEEAVLHQEHSLRLREEGSLEAASRLFGLARLLQLRGSGKDARPLLRRALAIREEVLGREDPATKLVQDNLAALDGLDY